MSSVATPGPAIRDFQERARAGFRRPTADLDGRASRLAEQACRRALSHRFQTTWCSCVGSTRTSMSAAGALDAQARSREPCIVSQNSVAELLDPLGERQPLEPRLAALGELQHVVDDGADAVRVAADDLREPPVLRGELLGFGQQLRRMAHRADGIADLVRDARAQAAERGELRLLHLLRDEARVLEEHQHRRRIRAAERREVRPDDARAVGRDEASRCASGRRAVVLPPGLQQIEQARRGLAEQRARDRRCGRRASARRIR